MNWESVESFQSKTCQVLEFLFSHKEKILVHVSASDVLQSSKDEPVKHFEEKMPSILSAFPQEWIDCLYSIPNENLMALAETRTLPEHYVPSAMDAYYRSSMRLHHDIISPIQKVPKYEFMYAKGGTSADILATKIRNPRKRIELDVLTRLMYSHCKASDYTHVLDIGGGKGEFASQHESMYHIPTISIDRKHRNQTDSQDPSHISAHLHRSLNPFHQEAPDEYILWLMSKPYVASLGLHTCGGLAITHMKYAMKAGAPFLVNVGCCYPKLQPWGCQVSTFCQKNADPQFWSNAALHLANGRHFHWFSVREAWLRKEYQYTIVAMAHHRPQDFSRIYSQGKKTGGLSLTDFSEFKNYMPYTVMKANKCTSFSEYLKLWCQEMNLSCSLTQREQQECQSLHAPKVKRAMCCRLLQDIMGRPLELLIHLDRALWMSEQGYQVQLHQMFPVVTSSRNIGLIAQRAKIFTRLLSI